MLEFVQSAINFAILFSVQGDRYDLYSLLVILVLNLINSVLQITQMFPHMLFNPDLLLILQIWHFVKLET